MRHTDFFQALKSKLHTSNINFKLLWLYSLKERQYCYSVNLFGFCPSIASLVFAFYILHISPGEKSGLFFISGLINGVTIATLKSISKHRSIPIVRNADMVSKLKILRFSSRILDLHNYVFMHLCNGFVPVVSVLLRFNCTNMRLLSTLER